jgi:hypothetical protein
MLVVSIATELSQRSLHVENPQNSRLLSITLMPLLLSPVKIIARSLRRKDFPTVTVVPSQKIALSQLIGGYAHE